MYSADVNQPVNIGDPTENTVLELADLVIEITGADSELVFEPLPVDDPVRRKPDITRARDLLGWEPVYDLPRLVDAAFDYVRPPGDVRKVWYVG